MSYPTVHDVLGALPTGKTIYYRANPGNAGDALIATGAYRLFDAAGLRIELVDPETFDATDKYVVYAGGGNLVGIYPEARDFIARFHRHARHLILLPHTVAKNEDLLAELGGNVTLFARERVSHEHLLRHATHANVHLDHDLALCLDMDEILASRIPSTPEAILRKVFYKLTRSDSSRRVPQPRSLLRASMFELRTRLCATGGRGSFFREDIEASDRELEPGNADLSKIYEFGTQNRELTTYTTVRLMRYIEHFSSVRTNRLHICIAAALLGKTVDFYPNSNFKCKAVYEYSLRDRFSNVRWHDK